jgi:uncharacterized membrane protein
MPAPETLAEYDRVVPGAAERIIQMAEADTTQQAESRKQLIEAEIESGNRGRAVALLLIVGAMVVSAVLFFMHYPIGGGVFLGMPLALVIKSFVPRPQRQELDGPATKPPAYGVGASFSAWHSHRQAASQYLHTRQHRSSPEPS